MKHILVLMVIAASLVANAGEIITWDSLRPEQTQKQTLSPSNKALITEIYAYEVAQQTRKLSPMEHEGYVQRIKLAEKHGLNVREAVSELLNDKRDSSAVIPNLNVDDMQLGGYLVPLEMDGMKGTQFILVPTAGACIHTPPPPANQTILVNFPKGYEMQSLYAPVWVQGNIKTDSIETSVSLSDGNQAIQTGYVIQASNIIAYQ